MILSFTIWSSLCDTDSYISGFCGNTGLSGHFENGWNVIPKVIALVFLTIICTFALRQRSCQAWQHSQQTARLCKPLEWVTGTGEGEEDSFPRLKHNVCAALPQNGPTCPQQWAWRVWLGLADSQTSVSPVHCGWDSSSYSPEGRGFGTLFSAI